MPSNTVHRVLLLFATTIVIGCSESGPELASVTGTVKLDGKPLENARVTFEPVGPGRSSSGNTNSNGYYELEFTTERSGAIPGKHNVRISTKQWVYNEEAGEDRPSPERVPPKYNIESTLTAEVVSGGIEKDFELSSDGFKPKKSKQEDFE